MINNVNANANAKTDGISVYKDCNRGTVAQVICNNLVCTISMDSTDDMLCVV